MAHAGRAAYTMHMIRHIARTSVPARRLSRRNTMTFPRALREAIPDLPTYAGRVLELHSASGEAVDSPLFGARVHLKLGVRETGKLKGQFAILVDLQPRAARAFAATLNQLADDAENRKT